MHAFPDKRSLLRHARRLLHERSAERFARAEAAAGDADGRLRAVLAQAATLVDGKREDARVWLAFAAAAVADPGLAALHRSHNRAFLAIVERLVEHARPNLSEDARSDVAATLVALVEGLNTLAALDPATYHAQRQRRAIDDAVAAIPGSARRRRLPKAEHLP
jgi:hypothetical protein